MIKLLFPALLLFSAEQTTAEPLTILDLPADHVIVLGELHGIQEIPDYLGDQIELLLNSGKTVRLGLELDSNDSEALNAAMRRNSIDTLHDALMTLHQWQTGTDARNGVAMASMLHRLGRLDKKHSGRLTVFSFDIPEDEFTTTNARDLHMATIIGQHRQLAEADEYVIVLVGNAHAFGVPGAPWDADFRSMVTQLKPHHPVISLRNAESGGKAWLCTPSCAMTDVAAMPEREVGIYLQPYSAKWSDEPVYDGIFFYGTASVSEPLPQWLKKQAVKRE